MMRERRPSWRIVWRRQCRCWRAERNSVLVSGGLVLGFVIFSFVLRAFGFGH
jgi:hypothetical protein